jgi:hypothetical protein
MEGPLSPMGMANEALHCPEMKGKPGPPLPFPLPAWGDRGSRVYLQQPAVPLVAVASIHWGHCPSPAVY